MPSRARGEIIQLDEVGVFHCWNRCVRRAFLCGIDAETGEDFDYRRDWIRDTEEALAALFAIEVAFRAEMSNHLHLILRTRPDVVTTWSDEDVVRRWLTVSQLTKSRDGTTREPSATRIAQELAKEGRCDTLRKRLTNPSWFMGTLCESIARRCNREDGNPGRFWEDRYKCRQLLDEAAILACAIYVDLNPIRAGAALTPESAAHTSAYDRIQARQSVASADAQTAVADTVDSQTAEPALTAEEVAARSERSLDGWMCELTLDEHASCDDPSMLSSATRRRASDKGLLPIALDQYLEVLDASGRMVKADGAGFIPEHLAPILERLGIRTSAWQDVITRFDTLFGQVVGAAKRVAERAAFAGRRWYRGTVNCATAFG